MVLLRTSWRYGGMLPRKFFKNYTVWSIHVYLKMFPRLLGVREHEPPKKIKRYNVVRFEYNLLKFSLKNMYIFLYL